VPGDDDKKKVAQQYWEYQAALPEKHYRQWLQGWETFRKADPSVHDAEVARYNELAKRSRKDNRGAGALEPDDLGRTFVQFPDARPLNSLPAERIYGPLPSGNPYIAPEPKARIMLQPGAAPVVAEHEQLHVDAVRDPRMGQPPMARPTRPADLAAGLTPDWYNQERAFWDAERGRAFEQLSPRERELWRVYQRLRNDERPHDEHEALDINRERAKQLELVNKKK
jgi:hypothetical protein